MTRINVGVPPRELSDKHLLAEHREIKRIPNMVYSGRAILKDIPKEFTLGKGHVKFFYDKLLYLRTRYMELYHECLLRGFKVTNYSSAWPEHPTGDYIPSPRDRNLILERIATKSNPNSLKDT